MARYSVIARFLLAVLAGVCLLLSPSAAAPTLHARKQGGMQPRDELPIAPKFAVPSAAHTHRLPRQWQHSRAHRQRKTLAALHKIRRSSILQHTA